MQAERWLPPLIGAFATASALAIVAVYAYGRSVPPSHVATVEATFAADPDAAWALVSDPARRDEWVPRVADVVPGEVRGLPAWRQLDESGDRFDFRLVTVERPVFAIETARPEDIGMAGRWTWRVEPDPAGVRVTVTEEGTIENAVFRGWWALTIGPHASIEAELRGFAAALGADARPIRRDGPAE